MQAELRKLNRWSWMFIAAGTVRALILPALGAVVASGGVLLGRLDWLSLVFIVPSMLYALIRQRVYSYRFTDGELVVRDGLLTRNVRHISYERVHNVALVRNPIHRMLGVTTARIETAAGGKPEAVLRVISLAAADELRRRTLGEDRLAERADADGMPEGDTPMLQVPDGELMRLGLISNRGFVVVAAVLGAASQMQWWDQEWVQEQDWVAVYRGMHARAPEWLSWLLDPGSLSGRLFIGFGVILLLLALLRLLSVVWYLVRYRGFTLTRKDDDLRTEYGLLTQVSSIIPVHRIQLVTVSSTLLHRLFRRTSVEIETAGASDGGSDMSSQLASSGVNLTRQWLAPITKADRALPLVHEVIPEVDLAAVEWKPIEARAARRIFNRFVIGVTPVTILLAALFTFTPVPVSGWHALWLPLVVLPAARLISGRWVRHAGYALTDRAVIFRSGWLARQISAVRFVNMQTVAMHQTPFDRRRRMASVAVDTAGAGNMGHRVCIPYLDIDTARAMLDRLYAETRATEFRW